MWVKSRLTRRKTQDGVNADLDFGVEAIDGIRLQTRHVRAAWTGGLNTVVSRPQGSKLVQGFSVAYHTCCGVVVNDVVVKEDVAFHLVVDEENKQDSISGQFADIRALFTQALLELDTIGNPFVEALLHRLVVVAFANQGDTIGAWIRLQNLFGFELVIAGAAEAHVVASQLAAANISVLLQARVPPSDFLTMRSNLQSIATLVDAGVKVGLGFGDTDNARNLRWEAGWAVEAGLTWAQALRTVTTNVVEILHLNDEDQGIGRIVVNTKANLLAFDGDPFSLQSRLQLNAIGEYVGCRPRQR